MRQDAQRFLDSSKKKFNPESYERTSSRISENLKSASIEYVYNSGQKIMEERKLHQLNKQLSSAYLLC